MEDRRFIAEVGLCENDIDWALRAVTAVAATPTWGFKVQLLKRHWITTPTARGYGDPSLNEHRTQWENFGVTPSYIAWKAVKEACDEVGLEFFASCFDLPAVEAAMDLGVRYFKIASADITYRDLITEIGQTALPVFMSTGVASEDEIARALGWLGHDDVTLLACTLSYPAEHAHLGRIRTLQSLFGVDVGYSDHTVSLSTPAAAWAAGATVVEKHVTIEKGIGGDHNFAALAPMDLRRIFERTGSPLPVEHEPLRCFECEAPAASRARRSAHAARDLPAGWVLGPNDFDWLRPVEGITADHEIVGRQLAVALNRWDPIGVDSLL